MLARIPVALAMTAILPAAALAADNDNEADAELVRLGAEFDRLYAEWLGLEQEAYRLDDLVSEQIDIQEVARSGVRGSQWTERCKEWNALRIRTGCEAAITTAEAKAEVIDALSKRIRAIPAVGIAGIAVKASLLAFECLGVFDQLYFWNGGRYEDADLDTERLHRFVTEMRTMAGLPALRVTS